MRTRAAGVASDERRRRRPLLPSWHVVLLAGYCTLLGVRLGWKMAISPAITMTATVVLPVQTQYPHPPTTMTSRRLRQTHADTTSNNKEQPQNDRILYIVTSLAEFDSGRRETTLGYDRFSHTIVPVLHESVTSLLMATGPQQYSVDVYFIAHYRVTATRYTQLRAALPASVGLQIWSEATPTAYELETSTVLLRNHTRGLARQHRFVIKDKFFDYDLFLNWEDDMLIRAEHVQHYQAVTKELYRLRQEASAGTAAAPRPAVTTAQQAARRFHGTMTREQLQRTIPGFLRVEVALPNYHQSSPESMRHRYEQVPVDYDWTDVNPHPQYSTNAVINASICCHVSSESSNPQLPQSPSSEQLYFWETSLEALGIRRMPQSSQLLTWVLLLGGNNQIEGWGDRPEYVVGDYWSGRGPHFYFGDHFRRPDRKIGRYGNNQGGWMATRRQVAEWHSQICPGSFLP